MSPLDPESFSARLEAERPALLRHLERDARGLLRFESAEDLAQEVLAQALSVRTKFEDRGPAAFRAWLLALARQQIARRHEHWNALKRRATTLLRITAGSARGSAVGEPTAGRAGPASLAERNEHLARVLAATGTLGARDQEIVRAISEGLEDEELALKLELSLEAASKARRRALERLKKAFEILGRAHKSKGSKT